MVREEVELRLPADAAFLAVLRTATAGLAARLDFTLDEIEDLRIAVDEACALLLEDTADDAVLVCQFALDRDAMEVTVSAPTRTGALPARDSFSWTVLAALAGHVDCWADGNHVAVRLRKQRGASEPE